MEVSPEKADRMCSITLSEPTDPRPLGLRLSVLYTTDVSVLRLKKFYNTPDLYLLLRACGPVLQCCKVSHSAEGDLNAVATLGAWMARKHQVRSCASYGSFKRQNILIHGVRGVLVHLCRRLSQRRSCGATRGFSDRHLRGMQAVQGTRPPQGSKLRVGSFASVVFNRKGI